MAAAQPADAQAGRSSPPQKIARIGLCWQLGAATGWGTYALNLAVQCAQKGVTPALFGVESELTVTEEQAAALGPALQDLRRWADVPQDGKATLDFPFLHALGNRLTFLHSTEGLKGQPDVGVVFFESSVIPAANAASARRFDLIVTGSTWNRDVLKRHGLVQAAYCPQEVDVARFAPRKKRGDFAGRFAVFSGGKLEYRKGQDLVVAAFKRFYARHPDALLVAAWNTPRFADKFAESLGASTHVTGWPRMAETGELDVPGWLLANGLPPESFVSFRSLPNLLMPDLLQEIDLAVFPSRCEGGTNLAAMECMAMGIPVVLSRNTGHLDLISADTCYALDRQTSVADITASEEMREWGESSVDEIVERLEEAYGNRAAAAVRGAAGSAFMQSWDWSRQIDRLLETIGRSAGFVARSGA